MKVLDEAMKVLDDLAASHTVNEDDLAARIFKEDPTVISDGSLNEFYASGGKPARLAGRIRCLKLKQRYGQKLPPKWDGDGVDPEDLATLLEDVIPLREKGAGLDAAREKHRAAQADREKLQQDIRRRRIEEDKSKREAEEKVSAADHQQSRCERAAAELKRLRGMHPRHACLFIERRELVKAKNLSSARSDKSALRKATTRLAEVQEELTHFEVDDYDAADQAAKQMFASERESHRQRAKSKAVREQQKVDAQAKAEREHKEAHKKMVEAAQ